MGRVIRLADRRPPPDETDDGAVHCTRCERPVATAHHIGALIVVRVSCRCGSEGRIVIQTEPEGPGELTPR